MYELIKELCVAKGISPTKLCTEITGSKGNLPTWQKGNINPKSLIKIADYFEVSTDYLLGRTDEPNPIFTNVGNNNSGNQAIHGNVTVSQPQETDVRDLQLLQMIQELSPVDYARVVLFINEMKNKEKAPHK